MNLQMWIEQIERRKEALVAADNTADSARYAVRAAGAAQIEARVVLAAAQSGRAPEPLRAAKRLHKAAKRAYRAALAAEDAALARCREVRMDVVAAKAAAWDAQASEAAEAAADEAAAQAVVEAAACAVAEFQEEELSQEELRAALSGDVW